MARVPTTAVLFQAVGRTAVSGGDVTGAMSRLGTACPDRRWARHDALGRATSREHYAGDRAAERIFLGAGVTTPARRGQPARRGRLSGWGTGARMDRYVQEALPLGKQAVAGGAGRRRARPGDVGLFAVATCTGYATPASTSGWPATSACRPACSGCSSATWAATPRSPASAPSATSSTAAVAPGRAALLRADQPARAARRSRRPRPGGRARAVRRRGRGRRPRARAPAAGGRLAGVVAAHRPLAPPTT